MCVVSTSTIMTKCNGIHWETLNDDICQLQKKKSYNLNMLVVRRERDFFCAATMIIANLLNLAHVYIYKIR